MAGLGSESDVSMNFLVLRHGDGLQAVRRFSLWKSLREWSSAAKKRSLVRPCFSFGRCQAGGALHQNLILGGLK